MHRLFAMFGLVIAPVLLAAGPVVTLPPGTRMPERDLTVSWVNLIHGDGSAQVTYAPATQTWESACSRGLLYELRYTDGQPELRLIYFTTGACPTGTRQYCSNLREAPDRLTLSDHSRSPFSLTFQSSSATAPVITNSGYTKFVVH